MISFPHAKINLGLRVTGKRDDGYHEIQSILYPVPIHDALEFRESNKTQIHYSGLNIPGDPTDNLVLKAYRLVKEDFDIPPLEIWLHKHIPMGGGLGGGSADGTFMLKMLNSHFQLEMDEFKLCELASALGSDCPFFIRNEPQFASGRGTDLQPAIVDIAGLKLLMIFPPYHSSTRDAYDGIHFSLTDIPLPHKLSNDPGDWPPSVRNDFEATVFEKFPRLKEIKRELMESGAKYAAMSGSGAAMFGLFEKEVGIELEEDTTWVDL